MLVSELSAAMALASADAVDREVDSWLGKICETLDSTEARFMSATRKIILYARCIRGFDRVSRRFRRTMILRGSSRRALN